MKSLKFIQSQKSSFNPKKVLEKLFLSQKTLRIFKANPIRPSDNFKKSSKH
jgi:hypothetical protein